MKNLVYQKFCNASELTDSIIAAGFPQNPNAGSRFYGISVDEGQDTTTVHAYDDLTDDEEQSINTIVGNAS
jgi:hypothetical protein